MTTKQLLAAAFALALQLSFYSSHAHIIKTDAGQVSGVRSADDKIMAYKGIPFAAPPVGNLRWKAPQPVKPWTGVRKCIAFGPSPMQGKPAPFYVWTSEFLIPASPISEDCLYLNVWTKGKAGGKKPVLVWIYGGGFTSGGSAVPIYDGEALARKDVVFVSINYRIGVFGFFAHPELTKESPVHASGNYGILDQLAALKWVKKNIAAFGGDPDNVTIAGQSAGAMSVNVLVASPLAKGLFHKAIAESGSRLIGATRSSPSLEQAEQEGSKAAQNMGANSLTDLRKLPADELMMKLKGRFGLITDGYVLPEPVPQIFAENKQNNVPVILGWNADEGIVMPFQTKEAFEKQVHSLYGSSADEVLKYYPAHTDEEAINSELQLNRDLSFAISGYQWARLQSGRHAYVYNFTRRPPATPDYVKYKSFHTAEVAYALHDLKFLNRPLEPVDHQLSDIMSGYWVNFAKTGNPNGKGLPVWPAFDTQDNKVMILSEHPSAQTMLDKARLDFMLSLLESK